MLDLTGKIAVVTGAGSVGPGWGNGRAIAVLLARQGAALFLIDINEDAANETRRIIAEEGGRGAVRRCDMTAAPEVQAAVEDCVTRFGRIDVLVNNVGGSAPGDAVTMTETVWDAQLELNLKATFLGCKYVLPVMERQGSGAIVNNASIAGLRNHVGRTYVAYSAAKAGVIALSRSTALAYAKKGIRCNTVVPGMMHTPLVEHRLAGQLGYDDVAALIAHRHSRVPMGRMGDAWDVAHAVLFLASDEARYVTATEIIVDGGLVASVP